MKALALVVVLSAGIARADQCEVVTPAQAKAAVQLLKRDVKFVEYCEPCGEKQPSAPQQVDTVKLTPWSEPPQQTVVVNGKEEDLAYLFVQKSLGDSHYLNVAVLAKCPAEGISREIDVDRLRRAPAPRPVQAPSIDGRP
jgi:hypothetical protein